ncbi:HDIG domain-containing protein [Candidatus Woesearchaeota archaeon]|nr:HDIG domain-containing protein [Candidatus Woesearchaeota archaeon]
MNKFTEKEALKLLATYAHDKLSYDAVLRHVKAVQKAALIIIKDVDDTKCDKHFIKVASLLHDIGRFDCPPGSGKDKIIQHGIIGAGILKKEGWPNHYQRVCERHIGIGIRKKDIIEQKLPLPLRDFMPRTFEEKIIAYADNLVDNDKIKDEKFVVERFRKEFGDKFAKRVERFHDEIAKVLSRNKK